MLQKDRKERDQLEFVSIEALVPEDHLLRKIDAAVDFSKIYNFVEDLYCPDNGRPSIDPVVLFKMTLIQHKTQKAEYFTRVSTRNALLIQLRQPVTNTVMLLM